MRHKNCISILYWPHASIHTVFCIVSCRSADRFDLKMMLVGQCSALIHSDTEHLPWPVHSPCMAGRSLQFNTYDLQFHSQGQHRWPKLLLLCTMNVAKSHWWCKDHHHWLFDDSCTEILLILNILLLQSVMTLLMNDVNFIPTHSIIKNNIIYLCLQGQTCRLSHYFMPTA